MPEQFASAIINLVADPASILDEMAALQDARGRAPGQLRRSGVRHHNSRCWTRRGGISDRLLTAAGHWRRRSDLVLSGRPAAVICHGNLLELLS